MIDLGEFLFQSGENRFFIHLSLGFFTLVVKIQRSWERKKI